MPRVCIVEAKGWSRCLDTGSPASGEWTDSQLLMSSREEVMVIRPCGADDSWWEGAAWCGCSGEIAQADSNARTRWRSPFSST